MAISSTTRKAGPYSGNGSTTQFPFSFKVFQTSDVRVVRADPDGAESILTLVTDYTVTLNADQNASPGGTVTTLVAPATSYKITLTSVLQNLQPVALTNQGGFYPQVLNDALDRLTILTQQNTEQVERAVKLPISSSTTPEVLIEQLFQTEENAADSVAAAANSATAAAASYDAFDDRYLGSKASAPATDNDGNALLTGALYWNSSANQLYVWTGSAWAAAAFNTSSLVTSFSAGSTGLTPSSASTGAVTLAGTLAVANGGTGVTSSTGTGSVVRSTSPTLVAPNLGTPASGTLTNCTGLPVAGGGTGAATLPANAVLTGNGTSAIGSVAPGASGNVLTSNGTAWTSAAGATQKFLQCVYAEIAATGATTGYIPHDGTTPQITEGTQFLSATITPVSATSRLIVHISAIIGIPGSGNEFVAVSAFDNATPSAIGHKFFIVTGGITDGNFTFSFSPGDTAAHTITLRYGHCGYGDAYLNRSFASSLSYGKSTLTIMEVAQ